MTYQSPTYASRHTEIHEGRAQREGGHKHKANLGKPVAASPLLVQAVVQKPLANGLSDFN